MIGYPSGQDGNSLACLGLPDVSCKKKFPESHTYNKSFIHQACLVKMAGYWLLSFFGCLWTSNPPWSLNLQKKNLANIQAS